MIRKTIPLICLFFIFTVMFSSCSKNKEETMEKNSYRTCGNTLEIALGANSTTGFTWHYEISDETVMTLSDSSYTADEHESGMTGVGGTQRYVFNGTKEGKCEISLLYYRNWEKEKIGADFVISLVVNSDLSVSVENVLSETGKTMQTI